MSECDHFGKSSEQLDAELGLAWVFTHCSTCPDEQACCLEATEKAHCNGEYELNSDDSPPHNSGGTQT